MNWTFLLREISLSSLRNEIDCWVLSFSWYVFQKDSNGCFPDQVSTSWNLFCLMQPAYLPPIQSFQFTSAQLLIKLTKDLLIKTVAEESIINNTLSIQNKYYSEISWCLPLFKKQRPTFFVMLINVMGNGKRYRRKCNRKWMDDINIWSV